MKYTHNKIEFCCCEMQDAFRDLRINTIYESDGDFPKIGPGVNVETLSPRSCFTWTHCPFCGERIEQVAGI